VTVAVTESLVVGLLRTARRSPARTRPAPDDREGSPRRFAEVGDLPVDLPVLDRYSGEYLPQGNDHPEAAAIRPFIYEADAPDPPSS
jgi:hypothetical protein